MLLEEKKEKKFTIDNIKIKAFELDLKEENGKSPSISAYCAEKIEENKKFFTGKTTLQIEIRGLVQFLKNDERYFTFYRKDIPITKESLEEYIQDWENLKKFLESDSTGLYYSSFEDEYISQSKVLNVFTRYDLY